MSNVPLPVLEQMLQLCDEHGWQKPTCYQGAYNVVTRGMETKLLPFLRSHGIKFNAFQYVHAHAVPPFFLSWYLSDLQLNHRRRPLGAGFLTGKLVNNQHAGTRFADDNPVGKVMQKMYGGEDLVEAMKKFDSEIRAQGMEPRDVAIRWLAHHSALQEDDGIVNGASKTSHVTATMDSIGKGPLPSTMVTAVEELWEAVSATRDGILWLGWLGSSNIHRSSPVR
jgi:aflatoxin B1 aldehyde reductase